MENPTVLIVEEDGRRLGKSSAMGTLDMGPKGVINAYDWRVWSNAGFGRMLRNSLPSGAGYWSEVLDCGKYLSVKVGYSSVATGKSVSKTFLIVFDDPRQGDGTIYATSTRWRTISNYSQAASYIGSVIKNLSGRADQT